MKTLIALCIGFIMAGGTPSTNAPFASQLYQIIANENAAENIILSPVSIETCLAMTYLGAEGKAASELQAALHLTGESKEAAIQPFKDVLAKNRNTATQLQMANRIYIADRFKIATKFNELATKYFESSAESVRFSDAKNTADKINAWVETQTSHKIQNLIAADSLDESTAAVLVNAIYFKANWTNYFEPGATQKKSFTVSNDRKVSVDTMYQEEYFRFGKLTDLNALAIEMPYEDSDISMLILLPNNYDGLTALEAQLKQIDLTKLSGRLTTKKVRLQLPKFKIDFDLSLQPALESLGIKEMFTPAADFGSLLETSGDLSISAVKHKAFIEINELGTTAAAATYTKIGLESLILGETIFDFTVDHPFFFAIKDKNNVYFAGHIVGF